MPDRDSVVTGLQIIRMCADFGLETGTGIQNRDILRNIVDWINDALALIEEQGKIVSIWEGESDDERRS